MKRGEKGKLNTRIWILIAIFIAMLVVLLVFLDKLAIRETEAYTAAVQQTTEVTTYQSGTRGRITDRNGVVLAYDETTYNVLFYRDPSNRTPVDSARYTYSLIEAIRIIEEGGGSTIDTFYIDMLSDGTFVYDFRTSDASVAASRKRNFIEACNFSNPDLSAEEAYRILRASWCIPDNMPFDEAKKIMSIRQEQLPRVRGRAHRHRRFACGRDRTGHGERPAHRHPHRKEQLPRISVRTHRVAYYRISFETGHEGHDVHRLPLCGLSAV